MSICIVTQILDAAKKTRGREEREREKATEREVVSKVSLYVIIATVTVHSESICSYPGRKIKEEGGRDGHKRYIICFPLSLAPEGK